MLITKDIMRIGFLIEAFWNEQQLFWLVASWSKFRLASSAVLWIALTNDQTERSTQWKAASIVPKGVGGP